MGSKAKISEAKVANIKRLKELGYPVGEIARLTSVSRVTVDDYTIPGFYEKRLKRSRDYIRKTILGTGATRQDYTVHKHLHKRPYPKGCEVCGRIDQTLYYHHWDDSDLNLGIWVCFKHHRLAELVDEKGPKTIVELMAVYVKLKKEIVLAEIDRGGSSSSDENER